MVEDCIELVNLAGSVVAPTGGFTLTLNIPEAARSKAYLFSKFSSDNVSSVFTLEAGSFKDVSHNLGFKQAFCAF